MKHAIETKGWMGMGLVLGAGMLLGTPAFSQRTSETAVGRRGPVVDLVDLSDDVVEQPGYVGEVSWQATPIADPAHAGGSGQVIEDTVMPYGPTGTGFAGPVQDAGTIVIDLNGDEAVELDLSFEVIARLADPHTAQKPGQKSASGFRLKLSGGEPLQPAAIVIRNDLPEGGGKAFLMGAGGGAQGVFDLDGTFVVELPADVLRHPLFAQGYALSGGNVGGSQVLAPKPSKKLRMQMNGIDGTASADVVLEADVAVGTSWSADPIADAAHGILEKTPVGKWRRARFLGTGSFAGLDEMVDVTVDLRAEPQGGGFTLRLSEDVALRNFPSAEENDDRRMHFATIDELAQAVVDVALVDTFSAEVELALSWSEVSLADARTALSGSQSIDRGAPGGRPASWQKFARQSGPTTLVERTIELEGDELDVQAGTASGINTDPHTASKKPARTAKKSAALYGGSIDDAGDVTVKAKTFAKTLRQTRELESASRTLELKRNNLKRTFARQNRP